MNMNMNANMNQTKKRKKEPWLAGGEATTICMYGTWTYTAVCVRSQNV